MANQQKVSFDAVDRCQVYGILWMILAEVAEYDILTWLASFIATVWLVKGLVTSIRVSRQSRKK